ncbi:glycosyltransferase [Streptomyces sp. B6B3]|uniref:glycosyltransferase n=1 Tax=Streptomyces sp. B6B3 TaxID=3153570 RepID=UPI00325F830D
MLSVIIATYNKRDALEWTLRRLARQRGDVDYDVVVAVDGSTDGTLELLDRAAGWDATWAALRVAHLATNAGRSAARNEALRLARGEYVVSLDDDVVPSESLLAEHDRVARSANAPLVTIGRVRHVATSPIREHTGDGEPSDRLRDAPREVLSALNRRMGELGYPDGVPRDFFLDQPGDRGFNELSWSPDVHGRWLSLISRGAVRHPWVSFATGHAGFSSSLVDSQGGFDEGFVGWGEEDNEIGYRFFRAGAEYRIIDVPAFGLSHHHDLEQEWSDWVRNYEFFVEKYRRPYELLLRWRLILRQFTGPLYERAIRRCTGADLRREEAYYERFLALVRGNPGLIVDWFRTGELPDELAWRG